MQAKGRSHFYFLKKCYGFIFFIIYWLLRLKKMISSFLLQTCFLWAILKVQLSRSPCSVSMYIFTVAIYHEKLVKYLQIVCSWFGPCFSLLGTTCYRTLLTSLFLYCKICLVDNGTHFEWKTHFSKFIFHQEEKRSKLRS